MILLYRFAVIFLLLSGPMGLAGCALPGGGERIDPVSGRWTGAWYRAGKKVPAGRLSFRMTPAGSDTWRAVVETASEVEATYELTMRGRPEGARVLFEGKVDLGRAGGGVYEWSGEVAGNVFQGVFRHPSGDGRFELVRRPEPESSDPVESPTDASPPSE